MEPILRFKADDGSDFSDWEKMTLGDVCVFVRNGYAYSSDGSRNHRYKLTRIESISGGVINDEKLGSSDEIDPRYRLVDGDILFSNINSLPYLGNVARYTNDLGEIYHGMNLLCIRPRANEINSIFLFELLGTSRIRRYEITHAKAAVNQCSLPSSDVKAMSLYCPSLPEQRKIADLLSAVDDVISAQEAEVAAWEKRKKGVMQKLFSQEVRFKADDGSDFPDWEERTFADVFIKLRNNTLSRDCLNAESGQARNIHYGDVLAKYGSIVDIQNNQVPFVNSDVECKRWDRLKDGDIVIADTAEDDSVGKAVEVTNIGSDVVYSGLHTIACRPRESFARNYLGYYMNSDAYHDQLRPYMQGITVTSVSKGNIALTRMSVPSLPEQCKIADCLASLDDVIAKAKDELDAWCELKKGLLQQMFV
jgi:type I restriction enzyme S subunit